MKKTWIILATVAGGIFAAGCQEKIPSGTEPSMENYKNSVVSDFKAQAAGELEAFFKSDDLTEALGINSDGQEKITASIKKYIDDYSMDEKKLSEAKESLEQLFENADGLSLDELQSKIAGILKE